MKTFELIRQQELGDSRLPAPVFASSRDHPLIQAADLATYIFGQLSYARRMDRDPPLDISAWAIALAPFLQLEKFSDGGTKSATARLFELLIAHSGGPREYQEKLQANLPDFLDAILSSTDEDDLRMLLNQEGLSFSTGMYKAASEDAALSKDTIAENSPRVQGLAHG